MVRFCILIDHHPDRPFMYHPEYSLKTFHTFGIDITAHKVIIAERYEHILAAWEECQQCKQPFLLLGEGSNVLFLSAFSGIVVINRIKWISVDEDDQYWLLSVGAGENWHKLVTFTLQHGIGGMENLALIPGCVGAAPIQNIGAYGVELKDICIWVDVLDLNSGNIKRLTAAQCQFGYRDSIFKHKLYFGYVIISVGFVLPKRWKPAIKYSDLTYLNPSTVTPQQIFNAVCYARRSKLPNPALTGNAGSFFKNPIISAKQASSLLASFPYIPHYYQSNGKIKLSAGWLIDQCQLKGYRVGDAAVHQQQALVLINLEKATAEDVIALAHSIRQCVGKKFNVWLEPEVRFIGADGERNAIEVIA